TREYHTRARHRQRARGARPAHALRDRHEQRSHAGGGGPAVLGDSRTHPSNRGQGAAKTEASESIKNAQNFSRQLRVVRRPVSCDDLSDIKALQTSAASSSFVLRISKEISTMEQSAVSRVLGSSYGLYAFLFLAL